MSDWIWLVLLVVSTYGTMLCALKGRVASEEGFDWWFLGMVLSFLGSMICVMYLVTE